MAHKYYMMMGDKTGRFALISNVEGSDITETLPLNYGKPLEKPLRDDLIFTLDESWGLTCLDLIPTQSECCVVSERLCNWFHSLDVPMESYPVSIRNHRGRIHKKPYYVLNLLRTVDDCVDLTQTEHDEENLLAPMFITEVVLDTSKIPEDARLFRISFAPQFFFFRDDLCAELRKVKPAFDGIIFVDPAKYDEMGDYGCDEV